jgi:hypothetical protein
MAALTSEGEAGMPNERWPGSEGVALAMSALATLAVVPAHAQPVELGGQ